MATTYKSCLVVYPDCCDALVNNPNDPPVSCIETWELEKKNTYNELTETLALAAQAEALFLQATEWEAKLKKYLDNAVRTDELADSVMRDLQRFKQQADNVCNNALCTIDAIKILYSDVYEVFKTLNEMKKKKDQGYDDMIKCIDNIDDPGLPKDKGVRKCLGDFGTKLEAALALQLDAFKKVLESLKCAYMLLQAICEKCSGLTGLLEGLSIAFGDKTQAGSSTSTPTPPAPCGGDLYPIPTFPLKQTSYYVDTTKQHVLAVEKKETYKAQLDEARKNRDALAACYNSLGDAIDMAKAAKNGK